MEYSQKRTERDHNHCQVEHPSHGPNLQRSDSGFALHSPRVPPNWRGQAIGCDRRSEDSRTDTEGRQSLAARSRLSGMFAAHCWNGGKFRCSRFPQSRRRGMNRTTRRLNKRLSRGLPADSGLID